jgi:protein disulfide-isomerase
MEGVCAEDDEKCFKVLNRVEDVITAWWRTDDRTAVTLHRHICVDAERVCCPDGRGGPDCRACPANEYGFVCSGHGACPHVGYRQSMCDPR